MTSRTRGVRGRFALVALVVGLLAVPAATARATGGPCTDDMSTAGGEWSTYGQNLLGQQRQDGEQTINPGNVTQLQQAWITADTGYQSPPPIVAGGCVFINTGGHIVAYDLATGATRWTSPSSYEGISLDTTGTFAVTVVNGRVHANLVNGGSPRPIALDVSDGHVLWVADPVSFTETANQESSAIVANGIQVLFTTGPDFDPTAKQGYALYDAATGQRLAEHLTLPADLQADHAGGGVWGTPTFDARTKTLYAGTSNPESKTSETDYDDSIIKIDLNRSHKATFGTIIGTYKGTPDSVTGYDNPVCQSVGGTAWVNAGVYGSSPTCGQLDVDFGVGPTLWREGSKGTLYGAATQKSGWLHIFNADTMQDVWSTQLFTSLSFLGGNLARIATDGETLYVAANPGILHAYDVRDPSHITEKWSTPLTGLPMKGGNVALANGVVYYVDEPGLKAFNAADGTPLLVTSGLSPSSSTGSGVAVAGGYVVANLYGKIAAFELP